MSPVKLVLLAALVAVNAAHAQTAPSTSGTLVVVPASAEVTHANDEAVITFTVEEQDKDKTAAAARVNRKMREGTDIVRRADPSAQLKTQGYYTVPVYPDQPQPQPQPMQGVQRPPVPVAWRVGQTLEVRTRSLSTLEKTAAAAQKVMAIGNVNFGLAKETERRLDEQRIAETYRDLNQRIGFIANAMGRKPSDAVIDTIDFEGSGNYAPGQRQVMMYAAPRAKNAEQMPEPSFEPGETTLQMRLVGKVKFK
jgi:uncharacterized protein